MSKFRKVAATPGIKNNLPPIKSFSDLMDFIKGSPQKSLDKFFTGENAKRNLNYLAGLMMGWSNQRYDDAAFKHVLEMDKSRGYKPAGASEGTKASEGAYETMSPELLKQLEDFKKNPPKNLTDFVTDKPVTLENITVPESSERYKAMQEKLYGKSASNKKFIKTSASTAAELKKAMPEWTIETVLSEMAQVVNNPRLSTAEKQKNMFDVVNKYEKEIAPLSEYLRKNGIQPK